MVADACDTLHALVREELCQPVLPQVVEMAAAIAALYPDAARAVLFYGSCLREAQLDGLMLDFYVIVSDYHAAYGTSWLATANRLIPPNVFPFAHAGLASKYAVLSEDDFRRECSLASSSVSVWARFAQPARLAWMDRPETTDAIVTSVAQAPVTLFQRTLPVMAPERQAGVTDIWRRGFALTYAAELRAERAGRSVSIVDADPTRYQIVGEATLGAIAQIMGVGPNGEVANWRSPSRSKRDWRWLQRKGKLLSVARLAKAAFTFSGGIDYLAWKINRHAGADIVITPWQRRHPLLAAVTLVPRLLRQGAVK